MLDADSELVRIRDVGTCESNLVGTLFEFLTKVIRFSYKSTLFRCMVSSIILDIFSMALCVSACLSVYIALSFC